MKEFEIGHGGIIVERMKKMWQNQPMSFHVKEKVVLITGAGKGAGRTLAEAFAEHGACVAANDISPINVEEVVEGILAKGGNAKAYVDDIAKKVAVQAMVNTIEDDFGRIDILINHAAVNPQFGMLEMDEWDWHRTLDVNLTGAFLAIQSVGRVMKEKGGGVIFNIIDVPNSMVQKDAAYFTSLAGLDALSTLAARELNPYHIQVFSLLRSADIVREVFAKLESL
jgi:NAD(P)-dependent dehydrogenase (short-subunit alcohol dehydrogenase family)